ncbi:peptidylprolyl isomerase [Cohnella cellulosilytica]|uniref:Peptidylprolyl isomerase n=1 Tax=Cohnella cellulosilytica TaxID=986710 RepID=A0ABW2FH62_9BACL
MLHHRSMPYRRLALLALAAVMLTALMSACGKKEKETVIATYNNGGQVTDQAFEKYIAYQTVIGGNTQLALYASIPQIKEQLVKQYIATKVLGEQISDDEKKKIKDSAKTFKENVEKTRNTQPDFKQQLKDNNLSVSDVVALYEETMKFQSYYSAKGEELQGQVTDEEIKAEFDKAPSDYNVVTVRHILVGTVDPNSGAELKSEEDALKTANEVKAKLEAGGDWEALAKEYSTDTGSKDTGGLYENQVAGGWVPEFKEAANSQPIGEIGEPVLSQYGYHVIKVESREEATSVDKLSEESRESIKQELASTKLNEFVTAEQDKLGIVVTLPEEPSESPSASESPSGSPAESPSGSPSESPSASPSASAQ